MPDYNFLLVHEVEVDNETSRLDHHTGEIIKCAAAGIPVILCKNPFDYNEDTLNKEFSLMRMVGILSEVSCNPESGSGDMTFTTFSMGTVGTALYEGELNHFPFGEGIK